MSRTAIGVVVIIVLAVGLLAAAGAAGMLSASSPTPGPVAVGASPSPAAVPSASPDPSASGGVEPQPSASAEPSASPSPTPAPTPVTVPAPLTGELVKPAMADRRVMAVMIDDQFDARPQSGLSDADVVWQAPAEGGIPRYMAFFQTGDPPAVGPVRSSRLYFIAWASEWRSLYVHAGGSPQAKALLASSKGRGSFVYNADEFRWGGGRYLWRVNSRAAPHNVYTDGKHLRQLARRVGADPVEGQKPAWTFADPLPIEQRPVGGSITVPYLANRITYKYDRASNTYRAVGDRREEADRRGLQGPDRPDQRGRHGRPLRATQRRQPQEPARGTGNGLGQGVDLDQRQDHPGHLEEAGLQGQDPVLRQERQTGHAHPWPDVRPGRAAEHQGHVRAGQGAAGGHGRRGLPGRPVWRDGAGDLLTRPDGASG